MDCGQHKNWAQSLREGKACLTIIRYTFNTQHSESLRLHYCSACGVFVGMWLCGSQQIKTVYILDISRETECEYRTDIPKLMEAYGNIGHIPLRLLLL